MSVTIINRLKKTGQEIAVTDRLGVTRSGRVSWFDDDFFSIVDSKGDDYIFSHIGLANIQIPGGIDKRAMHRSDVISEAEEDDEI